MMPEETIPYPSLDTPAVLLDLDALASNIKDMSQLAAEAGVKLRPHIKIHESAEIAKMQIGAGAIGVEVGSLNQVEPLADAGINDILVAHPFYGPHKVEMLKRLLQRKGLNLTFIVDMLEHAQIISKAAETIGRKVPVIIKLETGANRLGVLPGEPTLNLARQIRRLPNIELKGIYAHEFYSGTDRAGAEKEALKVAEITAEAAKHLRKEGIAIDHVSVGASPTFQAVCQYIKQGRFKEINEIHPGKLAVDDIAQAMMLDSEGLRRAVTVLATVISTSHPTHAVIDAGFKTFGFDALIGYRERPDFFWQGKPSYGIIKGRPDLWFGALHAEVGRVFYKEENKKLTLGERVEILPHNTTLVMHINRKMYGVRNNEVKTVFHTML